MYRYSWRSILEVIVPFQLTTLRKLLLSPQFDKTRSQFELGADIRLDQTFRQFQKKFFSSSKRLVARFRRLPTLQQYMPDYCTEVGSNRDYQSHYLKEDRKISIRPWRVNTVVVPVLDQDLISCLCRTTSDPNFDNQRWLASSEPLHLAQQISPYNISQKFSRFI